MAFYVVDVDLQAALWEQITEFGGRDYALRFRWNSRAAGWYMDVADQDEVPIVSGVRLVCGVILARQVVGDPRMWPGQMMCVSTTADTSDPGMGDLGRRVLLVYRDG